jgi:hypothetical protein
VNSNHRHSAYKPENFTAKIACLRLSACNAQAGKDPPTPIWSEELPDRNFPNCVFEFSRINSLNMQGSFASFACFAVELHYPG